MVALPGANVAVIKLERVRTAKAIPTGMRGQKRVERARELLVGHRDGTLAFTTKNSYWKSAKRQLKLESAGKCAYCEAPTATVAHGDVEHVRPKSVYWWLAYCYDNYVFACQICNQTYKGDRFPIAGPRLVPDPPLPAPIPASLTDEQLAVLAARLAPDPLTDGEGMPLACFAAACVAERSSLVDPYALGDGPVFRWEADPVLKEVSVAPRNQQPETLRVFADQIACLGLNREELRRARWRTFQILDKVRLALGTPGLPDAARDDLVAVVREMVAPGADFAGMVRYFVREVWVLDLA